MGTPTDPTLTVQGECAYCGIPVELHLGEKVDTVRWTLSERAWCAHCDFFLYYALRDTFGRFWGRRKVWND